MTEPPRTVVEFVDDGDAPAHITKRVFVNGTEVLVAEGGVSMSFGPDEMTTVSLDILAHEVHFRHPDGVTWEKVER